MKNLTINPLFKNLIPPLSTEEYQGLEESLLAEGCRDALIVWGDVLVDGHNRYEICHKHYIGFRTENMEFDSEDDVVLWILKNQLGRRNLSDIDREVMIGLRYKTEKKINNFENQERNEKGYFDRSLQKADAGKGKTSEHIANELGINPSTVQRSEHFVDGLEKIKDVDPEEAEKVRKGASKLTKTAVRGLRKADEDDVKKAIEEAYKPKPKKERGYADIEKCKPNRERLGSKPEVMDTSEDQEDCVKELKEVSHILNFYEHAKVIFRDGTADGNKKIMKHLVEIEKQIKTVKSNIKEVKNEKVQG